MDKYLVTTAETVYETYTVWAEDEDEARAAVQDSGRRAHLMSYPLDAPGDDITVMAVEPG